MKIDRKSVPIMVSGGSWYDMVPEWLIQKILDDREKQSDEEFLREATDSEVLAYLHTVSLEGLLDSDYANIMLYVFQKVMSEVGKDADIPEDIRVVSLSSDAQRLYENLKRELRSASLRTRSKEKVELVQGEVK